MENSNQKPKNIKWSKDYFIQASKEINGPDAFDYSEVDFISSTTKVTLICHNHDEPLRFYPRPIEHIGKKTKCPACSKKSAGAKQSLTKSGGQERFLADVKRVHGDRYDVSQTKYERSNLLMDVICPIHGVFSITQESFINQGSGCQKCAYAAKGLARRKSNETFLDEANTEHKGIYLYPEAYITSHTPIKIICKDHGAFMLKPYVHINGQGCYECSVRSGKNSYPLSLERFLDQAREMHENKFDYSLVKLNFSSDIITILCPEHGPFTQIASQHTWGYGCYKCSRMVSKAEIELGNRIAGLGFTDLILNKRHGLGFDIDIFIPSLNIGIEYNGLIWHSEWKKAEEDAKVYHLNKTEACEKAGIRLIHVWEDDWILRNETCWNWLKTQLGFYEFSINARDCEVKQCTWNEISKFIEDNHIQGQASAPTYCYRMVHPEKGLVGAMTFGNHFGSSGTGTTLKRFCTNGNVRGGFSKMLTTFIRDHGHKYSDISSFSDRSWSQGKVYSLNGFVSVNTSEPRYYWSKDGVRYNRWKMQLKYLPSVLKVFDPTLSETQNCHANGYNRIWDSGVQKWELKLNR